MSQCTPSITIIIFLKKDVTQGLRAWHDSSDRTLAYEVPDLEFNPNTAKNKVTGIIEGTIVSLKKDRCL
jgi:hypothetical protein